jgi:CubicO group peptidase (beta-lactamase class C family)
MPAASKGSAESEKVDRFVAAQIESRRVPGYAVAVVEGRRIAHARGFGTADQAGSPVTARTPFVLGSTSKSFTALAVMQLADEGRLDIGAPVGRYVSGLRLANRSERRITLRQLLNQTSGLPATAGGPLLRSVGDGDRAALLAELEGTRLWAEPGAAFQYSNANYVLLGMVVEEAAGMAYGEYVKTRIFDPLKMSDSFVSASAAKRSGLAVGHRYWFGFAVPHGPTSPEGIRAAGYLMSSAADMGRYLSMFLNDGVFEGRRLVSRQGLRTLLTPAAPATLGAWSGHQESEYAMGWFVGGPWREQAILHPGGTPDSSSMIVLLPKSRRAVVTLANANMELPIPGADGSTDRIARNVAQLVLCDLRSFRGRHHRAARSVGDTAGTPRPGARGCAAPVLYLCRWNRRALAGAGLSCGPCSSRSGVRGYVSLDAGPRTCAARDRRAHESRWCLTRRFGGASANLKGVGPRCPADRSSIDFLAARRFRANGRTVAYLRSWRSP